MRKAKCPPTIMVIWMSVAARISISYSTSHPLHSPTGVWDSFRLPTTIGVPRSLSTSAMSIWVPTTPLRSLVPTWQTTAMCSITLPMPLASALTSRQSPTCPMHSRGLMERTALPMFQKVAHWVVLMWWWVPFVQNSRLQSRVATSVLSVLSQQMQPF